MITSSNAPHTYRVSFVVIFVVVLMLMITLLLREYRTKTMQSVEKVGAEGGTQVQLTDEEVFGRFGNAVASGVITDLQDDHLTIRDGSTSSQFKLSSAIIIQRVELTKSGPMQTLVDIASLQKGITVLVHFDVNRSAQPASVGLIEIIEGAQ